MVRCAVEIRHSVFHVGKVTRRHRSGCPRPGLFALPFVPANTERVDCTEWRLRCHSEAKNGTYPANLRPWSPPFLSPRPAWDGMLQRNHMAASTLPARTAGRYSCVPPRPKAAPVDAPPSKYASASRESASRFCPLLAVNSSRAPLHTPERADPCAY
jgi:hypothetical protein